MKIRTKFVLFYLISFIIVSVFASYSIWGTNVLDRHIEKNIPDTIQELQDNSELDIIAQLIRYDDEVLTQSARNYAFTADDKWKDRYYEYIPKLDLRIKQALEKAENEDEEIFASINNANNILVEMEERAITYVDKEDQRSAQIILESQEYWNQKDIYQDGIEKYLNRRGSKLDDVNNISVQELYNDNKYLDRVIHWQKYGMIGFIALFFVILLILLWQIYTTFISPLFKFKEVAKKITKGDFDSRVNYKKKDEIGDFADDFNKMSEDLKKLIKNFEDQLAERTKDLQKFKLAVENAYSHMVITDKDGICLYMNNRAVEITGFSKKEIIGEKVGTKENWGGQMPKEVYKTIWHTIKTEKKSFVGELENKRKNGDKYIALASITPVLNEQGEVEFFIGIERDITHEKEVDKAKTEFVSLASHQLRTPLSAIRWYTEMLMDDKKNKLTTEQKIYVDEVYKGNKRMIGLVNALLNVSRIELGTFAVDPELVQLTEIAKESVKELQPLIQKKKLKIIEKYDKSLQKVQADPKLIQIVFQNLLSNAVKYSEKGEVQIEIKKDKENILIKVVDSGMGIPKSQQPYIFEKLFRADNAKASDTEGTGLGLYIVKAIVDQANGKIWFESEKNQGTTFYVKFPLKGMKAKEGSKPLEEEKNE